MKGLTAYQREKLLLLKHLSPTGKPKCLHPGGCEVSEPAFLEFHHINGDGYKIHRGVGGMTTGDLKDLRLSGRAKETVSSLCMPHHRDADRELGSRKSIKYRDITNIDTPDISCGSLKIDWDFQSRIDKLNPL